MRRGARPIPRLTSRPGPASSGREAPEWARALPRWCDTHEDWQRYHQADLASMPALPLLAAQLDAERSLLEAADSGQDAPMMTPEGYVGSGIAWLLSRVEAVRAEQRRRRDGA